MKKIPAKIKPLGICLSGGGALGFAHIGVLQALEENGIIPQCVSGSSMGAIVGTMYAAGYSPSDMMQLIKEDRLYRVTKLMTFTPTFWKSGWSNHNTIRSLIRELIPHNSFEQLSKKLYICVANLNTAQWEIKSSGENLDTWVSASASISGVFEAIQSDNAFYVDGGLFNNLPAQPLKKECSTIIGVNVLPHQVPTMFTKPSDAIAFSVRSIQTVNSSEGRSLCKYLIEPSSLKKFHEFSFEAYQKIYKQGYDDTIKYIRKHPEILELTNLYFSKNGFI